MSQAFAVGGMVLRDKGLVRGHKSMIQGNQAT